MLRLRDFCRCGCDSLLRVSTYYTNSFSLPGLIKSSLSNVCVCVLQEELRPEYEEALQEKKDKVKAQLKKKVMWF